jgi:hypothetical protein
MHYAFLSANTSSQLQFQAYKRTTCTKAHTCQNLCAALQPTMLPRCYSRIPTPPTHITLNALKATSRTSTCTSPGSPASSASAASTFPPDPPTHTHTQNRNHKQAIAGVYALAHRQAAPPPPPVPPLPQHHQPGPPLQAHRPRRHRQQQHLCRPWPCRACPSRCRPPWCWCAAPGPGSADTRQPQCYLAFQTRTLGAAADAFVHGATSFECQATW